MGDDQIEALAFEMGRENAARKAEIAELRTALRATRSELKDIKAELRAVKAVKPAPRVAHSSAPLNRRRP